MGAPVGNIPPSNDPPAETGPTQSVFPAAQAYSLAHPFQVPPGLNDWSCKPSRAHPYPVLLSNGTATDMYLDWSGFSERLADEGYCVFGTNIPGQINMPVFASTGPIAETARATAAFASRVLAVTGAPKLDVVGHSQGGMSPRYWIKYLGGDKQIHHLIALAPSNHGTDTQGLFHIPGTAELAGTICKACEEQKYDSPFLTDLNSGGETNPKVEYTVVETQYDDLVTPFTSAWLAPAPNVKQVLVQDICREDYTDHFGITFDPNVQQMVLNELDPRHAKNVNCVFVPPYLQ
jgi:triacylglycerol esterase/lipase EstA (alpha/beta hydrolase family)